jgi:hypothetical protein
VIRFVIPLVLAAAMALAPVSFAQAPPRPTTSKYLVTEDGGFVMTKDEGVMYAMTFSVRENLASPLYATILFDNPEDRRSPFVVEVTAEPGQSQILAKSPGIKRIKSGTSYAVRVQLYSDPARTQRVGKHVQKVLFGIPAEAMAAFGIEAL